MFEAMEKAFQIGEVNVALYSPLTLAYIGDCVYELIIRTNLVTRGNAPVNKLNKKASNLAKASTQARIIESIMDMLSEDEEAAYKEDVMPIPAPKPRMHQPPITEKLPDLKR